jgi:hypothetical protein
MTERFDELFDGSAGERLPPSLKWELWTVEDDINVFGQADSFDWLNARGLVWSLVDLLGVVAFPRVDESHKQAGHGVWQAALDLLAYGNGWVNIRRELNAWALQGFSVIDEPILARLKHDLGESLWALVWYLNEYPWASDQIENYLTSIQMRFVFPESERHTFEGRGPNFLDPQQIRGLINDRGIRERFPFTSVLLDDDGGKDPAHLSPHFAFQGAPTPEREDLMLEVITESHIQVEFRTYARWYERLHEELDLRSQGFTPQDLAIDELSVWVNPGLIADIWVRGIGFLGQFVLDEERQRFVRNERILTRGVGHRFFPERAGLRNGGTLRGDEEPFSREKQAEKKEESYIFEDVPPALQKLIKDMVTRVFEKANEEDADLATDNLRRFIAGEGERSQSEISSEMAKLLRMLT